VAVLHSQADLHSWHYLHKLGRHQDMVGLYRGTPAVEDIAHNLDSSGDKVLDTAELQQIDAMCSHCNSHHMSWNALLSALMQLQASTTFPYR
jgi:hypothetical protein